MTKPHKQLVVTVGVVEYDGRFLITRRVDKVPMWHHKWQLPGGKVEPGETPEDAVRREIREETGLIIDALELLGIHTCHWDHPEFVQQTFLLVYRAPTTSNTVVLESDKTDAHEWVNLDEYLAIPDHLDGNREMMQTLYRV